MLHHISFLAAVAGITCAAPAIHQDGQAEFSILQERSSERDTSVSRIALGLDPFYKYSEPRSLERRQTVTTSVIATPGDADDVDYVSNVTVGGQVLRLVFDTGGSDLWVYSTRQPAAQQAGHLTYNPNKSTTKKLISGATWNLTYSDGRAANGVVYADKVVLGGATATSQAVEAATSVSDITAQQTENDGTLGLAFSSRNSVKPKKQLTFFDNLAPTLKQKLFAADLRYHSPGSWDFGYLNTTKYTGSITYLAVNNSTGNATGHWGFTAGGYNVGSNKTMIGSQGLTIADTGTTVSTSSEGAVKAYYAKVPGATIIQSNVYTFPCTTTLPAFQTSLGGRVFTIPGKYFNAGNIGPITSGGQDYCYGGLQYRPSYGFNIYGLSILRAFYVVFDQTQAKPRLGFATKNLP